MVGGTLTPVDRDPGLLFGRKRDSRSGLELLGVQGVDPLLGSDVSLALSNPVLVRTLRRRDRQPHLMGRKLRLREVACAHSWDLAQLRF